MFAGVAGTVLGAFVLLMHTVLAGRVDQRNLTCLALNVYHEARGEPLAGQYAVAEVTMNRVASPRFPDTVCDVVYEQRWDVLRRRYVGAFSWTEFETRRLPRGEAWQQARAVAEAVYFKRQPPTLDGALFYHAVYIRPSWSRGNQPVARIGKHIFYR